MYKSFFIFAIISLLVCTAAAQDLQKARRNLMPVPSSLEWKNGRLPVTKNFTVAVKGQIDDRLKNYIFRVMRRLEGRTILELSREFTSESANANLLIETQSTGNATPK